MSNAFAIAGVTAVIRDLLNNGVIDHNISAAVGQGVLISTVAPDLIPTSGNDAGPRLNLFLHQVTHNAAWRNVDLPSRDSSGERRTSPPLALNLHYLLTSYARNDLEAEVLLGYGMQLLHETPMIGRAAIRKALNPATVSPTLLPQVYQAMRQTALAEQIEMLKIIPENMNSEEMSRLWSATQAHYRPSAPYQVTVVLIESERSGRSALPVLTRGPVDPVSGHEQGIIAVADLSSPYPEIDEVMPPNQQTAVRPGETVSVRGSRLDGTPRSVQLFSARLGITREVPAIAGKEAGEIRFVVPNDPANLPAGTYLLSAFVLKSGETQRRQTNDLLLRIAPTITTALPITVNRDGQGTATITLAAEPSFRTDQQVSLILGSQSLPLEPITATVASGKFVYRQAVPGSYLARLRVDGVESIIVNRAVSPPVFFDHRVNVV